MGNRDWEPDYIRNSQQINYFMTHFGTSSTHADADSSTKGTLIVWNADEITNFVRKLGFLGAKKVKGNDIMQFQNLYEVIFLSLFYCLF